MPLRGRFLQFDELDQTSIVSQQSRTPVVALVMAGFEDLESEADNFLRFAGQISHFLDEVGFEDVILARIEQAGIHGAGPVNLVWASGGGDGNRLDWGFRG